jgi:serine/threonine-protein kinase
VVTGTKPFEEDAQHSILERIRNHEPPAPHALNSSVPRDLDRIIRRCMEKDPRNRFETTQELVVTLEQYLAAHVNLNYRARLLLYLQQMGVLSEDEATNTLHPALIGSLHSKRPLLRIRRRTRRLLLLAAVVWIAGMVGGVWAMLTPRQVDPVIKVLRPVARIRQEPTGSLRVLAHPWARVEVDGKMVATTPLDRPLTVRAGLRKVRLSNPYFKTEVREVEVEEGQVATLTVVMRRSGKAAQ